MYEMSNYLNKKCVCKIVVCLVYRN